MLLNPEYEDNMGLLNILNYFTDNLYAADVKGVIVDLRGNGGGYLWNNFFGYMFSGDDYKVGYSKSKMGGDGRLDYGPLLPYTFNQMSETPRDLKVPLVALINNFSVSASEISALFVRSRPNGFLVGSTTWGGQGGMQDHQLANAGIFSTHRIEVAYTACSQFFDLNRASFEGRGVSPDYYVPFNYDEFSQGIDRRLEKAIEVIKGNQ
jgi:carboxyl-terminal processing protease